MSLWLRQSTAQTERIGPFLDKDDGITEETSISTPSEISKNGGLFATGPSGTHDAEGWYSFSFTTTHTNTLGSFVIKVQASATHLPVWREFMILPANIYDTIVAGSANVAANVIEWSTDTVATPDTAGIPKIDVLHWRGSSIGFGGVPGIPQVNVVRVDGLVGVKNQIGNVVVFPPTTSRNDLAFLMVDETDGKTPETGLTVTGERSTGSSWVAVSGTITEVGNGIYQFDALAADMPSNLFAVEFRFSATGALDTFLTVQMRL